ncbi:Uncharacterized protein TCM_030890 [Theobroma cacao]|uniref:KIB1-4 beta-propeller domain-containing protein n=1 Tax=Theobroma cacao TaxID=3641 RepID=A0A061F5N4_THECC|nr:Uncharacterized protein TCM_030890 [Theobroma cacao]
MLGICYHLLAIQEEWCYCSGRVLDSFHVADLETDNGLNYDEARIDERANSLPGNVRLGVHGLFFLIVKMGVAKPSAACLSPLGLKGRAPQSCGSMEFWVTLMAVSSELISLPPLDLKPDQRITTGSLLSPPGNPGSMVLEFEEIVKSFIFCELGDKKWTEIPAEEMDVKMQIMDNEPSARNRLLCSSPVNYKGKWYVPMSRKIKVIDQVKPKHMVLRSLNCMISNRSWYSYCEDRYLVESCGELCVIEVTWGGVNACQVLNIEISRLDFSTMEWSQVRSAKDRAFFISNFSVYAISCPANESGIEGGFVYYTVGTDRCLYSFNIEDKSISVSLPWVNLPKSWSTPFWVMPDLREYMHLFIEPSARMLACLLQISYDFIDSPLFDSPKPEDNQILGNSRTLHNFMDPKPGGRYLMNIPEPIIDFDIRYSKEGWLLMSSRDRGMFVDNLGERVFEFDYSSRAWHKVRDLGNYMFFVSTPSSFSMVAKTPGMENKIYFPKIKGEEIVYYCLRTGKFRTFGSKQFAANFYNTTEYLFSTWIQQRWL